MASPAPDLDNDDLAVQLLRMFLEEVDVSNAYTAWEAIFAGRPGPDGPDLLRATLDHEQSIKPGLLSLLDVKESALDEAIGILRGGVKSVNLAHQLARLATVLGCEHPEHTGRRLEYVLQRAGVESLDILGPIGDVEMDGVLAEWLHTAGLTPVLVSSDRLNYILDMIRASEYRVFDSMWAASDDDGGRDTAVRTGNEEARCAEEGSAEEAIAAPPGKRAKGEASAASAGEPELDEEEASE